MRRTLIVFLRAPSLGRGKRRLARDIGAVPALAFQRTQVACLLRRLGRDPRWRTMLAVTPDDAVRRRWPIRLPAVAQGRGDLGARMARALATPPPGAVVLIGADIPSVTRADVWSAFRTLGDRDLVLGPARDGGYWLIGMRRTPRPPPRDFGKVRWSSRHALADTLANLGPGRRVAMAATREDIDDGAAWRRWRALRPTSP
ncbi:MAG: TIGR04282 family arsenosugar biosynthesis glycosyltransferase [Alphaproteobacteria bacterium]